MDFNHFILARVIHILAVVVWIGGVAFVTTVLIPSIRKNYDAKNGLELFESLEGKFSFQAKFTVLLTGLSGAYMLHAMDAWWRLTTSHFWWLYPMIIVWSIFFLVLFVLEPLYLHKWFHKKSIQDPVKVLFWLQALHIFLLGISLLAITIAMAGSHGFSF